MKRVLKIIGVFFSIVLLIPIFALEFLLTANLILNSLISSDNLDKTLEELMSYNPRNSEVLITIADPNTYGTITYNDKINYSMVKDKIKDYLTQAGFEETEAKEIVEDEEFKSIVSNYLESVVLNKIKDSDIRYPTKEEIKSFVKKNYSKLKKVKAIEEKYTEDNIEELVEDNYEEVKNKLEEIEEEINVPEIRGMNEFKQLISLNPFLLIVSIIGLIELLMLTRMSFYKWLAWASIPTLFNGILYSAGGLFGIKIITSLVNLDKYADIIDPIAKKLSTLMIRYGIVYTILTIVMIASYSVIKNNLKSKTKSKKA